MIALRREPVAGERLSRHALAWPAASGWKSLLGQAADTQSRDALSTWQAHAWPLVVRRAENPVAAATVALGLPLPPSQGKRRLGFVLAAIDIEAHAAPPLLRAVAAALPSPWDAALRVLDGDARAAGHCLRVFGAAMWQSLTGLAYLTATSDIDLLLRLRTVDDADHGVRLFTRWERATGIRADGELIWPDGEAIAWREWAGGGTRVLVKHRDHVRLAFRAELCARLQHARAVA